MTVFSLQTRPSNPPKRRLCFFSNRSSTSHKQKLHQPPTKAPPTTNKSSANHQQKLRQPPTEAPPTTNRSSAHPQQKLRQPPTEHPFHPHSFPGFMKEEKKQRFAHRGTLYSSTPVRTEPHPLRIAQERRTFTEI